MALLHCGFTSSRVISTLYALNYGQPAWMVGVILSTYAAIPALISIHVGKFIDKIGVRIPITVSFLMISAACLMPILFPYEKFGFWPIIVTSLLAGTGFVFTLISGQGLIGHLSNNKNRATAFTYQSIAFSISGSTGPVVAGYLIDHGSYYWAFGGALTFALLGGGIFLFQARALPSAFNKSQAKDNRHHSAFELFKDEKVRNVLLASAFVSMAWDLQAFMIPVCGTEIDRLALEYLLHLYVRCSSFHADPFSDFQGMVHHYFRNDLGRSDLYCFSFYDIAHASLPTLRMARRVSRSFSAERSFTAPSGNA